MMVSYAANGAAAINNEILVEVIPVEGISIFRGGSQES